MTVPREEEEKVALRGAENKWGKDSDSYLEVRWGGGGFGGPPFDLLHVI